MGHWIHSYEEDAPDLMLFRPSSYGFPPSRGRRGIEFMPKGELIYHGISQVDGIEQTKGNWRIAEPDTIRIKLDSKSMRPITLHILSCTEQSLELRWITE